MCVCVAPPAPKVTHAQESLFDNRYMESQVPYLGTYHPTHFTDTRNKTRRGKKQGKTKTGNARSQNKMGDKHMKQRQGKSPRLSTIKATSKSTTVTKAAQADDDDDDNHLTRP